MMLGVLRRRASYGGSSASVHALIFHKRVRLLVLLPTDTYIYVYLICIFYVLHTRNMDI